MLAFPLNFLRVNPLSSCSHGVLIGSGIHGNSQGVVNIALLHTGLFTFAT